MTSLVIQTTVARRLQKQLTAATVAHNACDDVMSCSHDYTVLSAGADNTAAYRQEILPIVNNNRDNTGACRQDILPIVNNNRDNTYREIVRKWRDFALVFGSRTSYYFAISCQAFLLYYIRDVVGTIDVVQQQQQLGILVFLSQGAAACTSVPFGKIVDSANVSKKKLIYCSCGIMSVAYGAFLLAPVFGAYAFMSLLPVAVLYGVGNGCFLAVDYALALATTPDEGNTGKALGLWGVAFFVGAALGPALWSSTLSTFGRTPKHDVY
eukprot:CAMPEP_0113864274 /NCGR_PEP_ID=MMETSP0372-20130328/17142_1 /TAXON_ID=340204 /ORGANISM="Lankesteria abbotti" /LENGTH=266 /DNA_ID=CAMNT_0000847251 /DNA_START=708 /DNA_END=1505 /DNA_ORIENTATION=+ /assembly_acc=CAM_ASM_000359